MKNLVPERNAHRRLLNELTLLLAWMSMASLAPAEMIPADRRINWQGTVGIVGGIPNVTTIYTTFNTPPTLTDLATALSSCPSNQVVKLGAWTNTYSSDLVLNKNGVVLRGTTDAKGRPLTKILFDNGRLFIRSPSFSSAALSTEVDLTADGNKGSTTISVTSTPSWIKAGELCIIDELDDTNSISGAGQESGQTYREIEGNGARGKAQLVKVVSKTATTVTLESPLNETYRVSQTAQLSGSGYNAASSGSLKRAGVEDIRFEYIYTNSGVESIRMENCDSCWLKNVQATNCPGTYHVWSVFNYRCQIQHSEFSHAMLYGGGQGYGIALYHYTTAGLFEDNIVRHTHVGVTVNYGSSGNVFAYNYLYDGFSTSHQEPSISAHGVSTWQCLFEGNYCHNKVLFDFTHGSGGTRHTVFRNRVLGFSTDNGDQVPISIERFNRGHNIIGNVLGVAGTQGAYARIAPASCSGSTPIYRLGYFNNPNCDTTNYDTLTVLGPLIHANYDVVTTTNNGIVWDSSTPDRTLPNSYYLAEKPAWFGNLTWPPFSPASPSTASATNLPAGYRSIFGTDPPFISIARSGTNAVITWAGGSLLQADQVAGPYTNVAGATSPFFDPMTAIKKFFRVLFQ